MKHADAAFGKRSATDIFTWVLAAALLVTLALASLYGFKYGNVDEGTAPGNITIYEDGNPWLIASIDDGMNARVGYLGYIFTGTFRLAGAEEDTVLYQLRGIEFASGPEGADALDAVFFLRVPRTGLQGDFSGPWMAYFSWPSQGVQHSDWMITREDSTASVGARDNVNAITAQRARLLEWSSDWTWHKSGHGLYLDPVAG